ncbi:Hypothetical protein CINCED_3A003342 [Cinara cedri]|uniref:Uncharacterized protein n=1 Tax=Cinara cedri TaxID=506608 RepID=A0A5E4M7J9_9HEMI|nr:Hypothetical protein CINCED_3A003342 [Cinara cedri]
MDETRARMMLLIEFERIEDQVSVTILYVHPSGEKELMLENHMPFERDFMIRALHKSQEELCKIRVTYLTIDKTNHGKHSYMVSIASLREEPIYRVAVPIARHGPRTAPHSVTVTWRNSLAGELLEELRADEEQELLEEIRIQEEIRVQEEILREIRRQAAVGEEEEEEEEELNA